MKKFRTDLIHFGYINKNGRIYEEENIDLNNLNNSTLLGELGDPNRFEISLSNVSHQISNFEISCGTLYGDIQVLSTTQGEMLEKLLQSTDMVFRPRGSGVVNKKGTISDYNLYAFDAIFETDDFFDVTKLRLSKLKRIIIKMKK